MPDQDKHPEPDTGDVISRLGEIARDSRGLVTLLPGIPDRQLSSSPIPVPDNIRAFLREVSGFTINDNILEFNFNRPENYTPATNEVWPLGSDPTSWILHSDGSATTYYADVDPERGTWGRIFSFWEDPYSTLIAPSFMSWVDNLSIGIDHTLEAVSRTDHPGEHVRAAFSEWLFGSEDSLARRSSRVASMIPLPALEAQSSDDPEIADVASQLPDDAFLADLRVAEFPTEVNFEAIFPVGEYIKYQRLRSGTFLAATIIPDE